MLNQSDFCEQPVVTSSILCVLSLAAEAAADRLRFSVGGASGGPARRGA